MEVTVCLNFLFMTFQKFKTPGIISMRFYSLSENPNKPCYIVQFKQVSIMLDCGLDISTFQHFLPLPVVEKPHLPMTQTWWTVTSGMLEPELGPPSWSPTTRACWPSPSSQSQRGSEGRFMPLNLPYYWGESLWRK